MKRKTSPQSGALNPRIFAAVLICSAAAWLGGLSAASNRSTASVNAAGDPPTCNAPGTQITTDPTGDQTGAPAANQQFDIQSVSIAEPCLAGGADKLLFTMKVANLASIPANGHWKIQFVAPPVAPATTGVTYFVEMASDQSGNVSYNYGTVGTTTTTVGTADDGSTKTDGTITITIANSKVGSVTTGQAINTIQGRTQLLVGAAGTGLLSTIDTTTVTGTSPIYTLVGHSSCTCPAATPTPTPAGTPAAAGVSTPRFQTYVPPPTNSFNGGEPSIGANWLTGNVMYLASFSAIRVAFDDCPSPARDTWTNTNVPAAVSLDPILFTDHIRAQGDKTPDRTFVSQLTGQDSITFFTDNDGASYLPSQGGGIPSGVDHQTIGAGPYHTPVPGNPVYQNAVYYCSQDIATAFCARSDDGGVTFGAGVPIYTVADCTGIHGHVKVAPDGTAYVPNRSCNGKAAVAVSTNNGITWTVKPVPTSSTTGFLVDPSVGVGTNTVGKPSGQTSNTIYLGYQASNSHPRVAVSHDQGGTWVNDREVGAEFAIQNSTFPELVTGDDNRAAYAFFGTTVPGNYTSQSSFPSSAAWHLYIATTFDGGASWTTADATPSDPVQRGSICNLGTTSCMNTPNDRNLLDFMDETVDAQGRVLVGYPDGCIGSCVSGTTNSFTALASIARQSGGKRLFAANDPNPAEPVPPAPPRVDSVIRDGTGLVHVQWSEPDSGGSPILSYKLYRRTDPGAYGAPLATLPAGITSYDDNTADPNLVYFYKVTAVNAIGEGLNCGEFAITAPPPINPCIGRGFLVDADPTGDQVLAPMNSDLDVQAVLVAEPYQTDGVDKLVFTMKVASLSAIPANRQWRIIWTPPVAPSTPGTDRYYVGMNSNAGGAAAVTYEYGVVTANGNVPIMLGAADAGSVDASGIIQIAIANNKVGNPKAGAVLTLLSGRNFAGNGAASLTKSSAVDSTADGSYTLVGNAACRANTAPIAVLTASPTSGVPPLSVSFSGSGSSDPDTAPPADTVASYTFDFGDGSPKVTQPTPTISHTYNAQGDYNARLTVTDSRGKASVNEAVVVISVSSNTPPVADLKASPTSGTAPLAVHLDGTGSYDPDFQDTINSYTFQFGDGSSAVTTGQPTVDHSYANSGVYTARLVVTDSRGAQSENIAQQNITVSQGPTPTPGTTATPTATATATPTPKPKAAPTITTQASGGTLVGGSISDTATLAGGSTPTGNITFRLFGPDDTTCGAGASFTSTVAVNGDGNYPSGSFTPTKSGTYRWVATYSGDSANQSANTACNEANESVTVSTTPTPTPNPSASPKTTPGLTTHASADTTLGGAISDKATLSGGSSPTGNVTFQVFGPDDATCGAVAAFSSTVAVNGAGNYNSASFTPTAKGTYRWVATYSGDSANNAISTHCGEASETATVSSPTPTATPTPQPTPLNVQLLNISGRVYVQGGENVGIGGFIVSGRGTKRVMARAIGPSLNVNGKPVEGRLQDPVLEMHDNNGNVLTNDNWRDSQEAEIENTGLAPADDKEAAIVKRLPAGNYTAIIHSASASPGIGLIELYDLSSDDVSELGNLSVRAHVLTDDNVLIDGVILRGGIPKRVLFRALGPELRDRGIIGELQDPTLDVYDQNGALLRRNDNWKDEPNSAEIQLTGLAPKEESESAVLLTLLPGNYTSIVRGANGTTGVALNEVFKLNN